MASAAFRFSPFLSPPSILLVLFLTVLSSSSSSSLTETPYAKHCSSIVHESIPTRQLLDPISFQLPHGYFSGGGHLLDSDFISGISQPNSFRFRAEHLHRTKTSGIIQVRGTLTLSGGETHTQGECTRSSDGSIIRYNSTVRKEAIFDLSGFWSSSSGKLCMVGRGVLEHAAGGSSLDLSAILKLNYTEKSNISTSLASGFVESLDAPNSPNHFSSIQILAYAQKKYEYTMISQAKESCSRHISEEESAEFDSNSYCPRLRIFQGRSFRLNYGSDCSSPNCGPFGRSNESFMSLNLIQCTEKERLHFYIGFSDVDRYPYSGLFVPEKSLVGEGFWDPIGNGRLCIMACRILNFQGDSLANASVGDCTIGLSLWFSVMLSIENTNSAVGRIWSGKTVSDTGYFSEVSFSIFGDDSGLIVPGLKYKYTKLDTVRTSCAVDDVPKLEKKRYPDGRSFDNMRLYFEATYNDVKQAWGHATPISVGETVNDGGYVRLVPIDETYSGDIHSFTSTRRVRTSAKTEQTQWNVSYKISYTFPAGSTPEVDVPTEISAEGIYNVKTGKLCMVGCRYPSYLFAKKQGNGVNTSIDCEILINIQLPPLNPGNGERFSGTITSTRSQSDPLFFDRVEVLSFAIVRTTATVWRMDIEIIMVVISLTLSCIFIRMQFYHLKKNFPSISITMLVVLTLGHMIPLMVNFGAWFYANRRQHGIMYRRSGWLEANEVIVRVMTMVSFLLHLRLLQVAWSSRSAGEGTKKGLWVAEKRALMLCLPLYLVGGLIAWFVHTRSYEIKDYSSDHRSLWVDLRSYCGLILDGFLLPQIILNIFWNSKDKALTPFFYLGTTILRAAPHLYDAYRAHHYVPHLYWSYVYASHGGDLYSTGWNIIIPFLGVLFAFLIYLQQRFGGDRILPKRFRKPGEYETVPIDSLDL